MCLIINFLQTRDPPILPSLQARPHKRHVTPEGLVCSFDDDLASLVGFGRKNKQSLADLLLRFFRYYGYELDYETAVISIREGKVISKESKGWHLLQNNRLCVEEAFNTMRNLGNTADDTSFRGLQLELRRAFSAISDANLEECCAQYEFPPEEERFWERPPPQPRPTIAAAASPYATVRGNGSGIARAGRGGRAASQYGRGANLGRRVSSSRAKPSNLSHPSYGSPGSPSDTSLQAQQAQFLLHDHLYQQIQFLQAQEQELRLQLQNQSLLTGRPSMFIRQPFVQFPIQQQQRQRESTGMGDESNRTRSGAVNNPRQQAHYGSAYFPLAVPSMLQGSNTNPPSPSTTTGVSEFRRSHRRASTISGSPGGSLRAHSQPARSQPNRGFVPFYATSVPQQAGDNLTRHHAPGSPERTLRGDNEQHQVCLANGLPNGMSRSAYIDEGGRVPEYVGYYVSPSQYQSYPPNSVLAAQTSAPLYQVVGQAQSYRSKDLSQTETWFADSGSASFSDRNEIPRRRQSARAARGPPGPLIVDGSVPPPANNQQRGQTSVDNFDAYAARYISSSDDHNTSASGSDSLSQDLQDNSSIEADRPLDRQPPSPQQEQQQKVFGANKANGNGPPTMTLANHLQRLHLSNSSTTSMPRAGVVQRKVVAAADLNHLGGAPRQSSGAATEKAARSTTVSQQHQQQWSRKRTPSPSKRRSKGSSIADSNTDTPKTRTRSRNGNQSPPSVESQAEYSPWKAAVLNGAGPTNGVQAKGIQTNGVQANGVQVNGGWQTTKKKQKKKSEARPPAGHGAIEPLPVDEAMRKGG